MESDGPLVSVIMNCYNGERYLGAAVESVLSQTYRNWEVIFWDNRSTDASARIFKSYGDERLRYFLAPNHTVLYAARNLALREARGSLIAFLDVDDWWEADKLQCQVPLFADPGVGLVYGNYWMVDENGGTRKAQYRKPLPEGHVLEEMLKQYRVGMLTMVVRRSAMGREQPFDGRFQIIGDFDLAVGIARRFRVACCQKPVACYRWHGGNMSAGNLARLVSELDLWVRESDLPPEVLQHVAYQAARLRMLHAMETSKREAVRHFMAFPWGPLKLRLFAAMLAGWLFEVKG